MDVYRIAQFSPLYENYLAGSKCTDYMVHPDRVAN